MILLSFIEMAFPRIDPAIIRIPAIPIGDGGIGPLAIRWYATAYLAGAVLGYLYLCWIRRYPKLFGDVLPPTKEDMEDLVFNVLLGVLICARLGYILFYYIPFNPDAFLADPWILFRLWEGGMSYHGGLVGTILALMITARMKSMPMPRMFDLGAIASPIGLFLGRLTNFINGELYGRPTDVPWAVRFPHWNEAQQRWIETGMEVPVHPSQLYEAALEGLLLFSVLAIGAWRFRILAYPGLASALYMSIYAFSRMFVEQFRQPDAHIGLLPGGITMGSLLSLPMLAVAVWMGWIAWQGRPNKPVS